MLRSISHQAKSLYNATKSIPVGFGKLFKEAKHVALFQFRHSKSLILQDDSKLSRKEINQTRSHTESIKRLLPILLFYVVPVIGNFPIFIALAYPKYMLTYHFWSDEQKELFLNEDFIERRNHALKLFNNNKSIYQNKQLSENMEYLQSLKGRLSLKTLSSTHLRCLAGSNGIFRTQLLLKASPKWILLSKLRKRARELIDEDKAILDDCLGDFTSWNHSIMSLVELQQFCSRRGFEVTDKHSPSPIVTTVDSVDDIAHNMPKVNSTKAIDDMAQFYRDWLECSSSFVRELRKSGDGGSGSSEDLHLSLSLHLTALSTLRNT